MSVIYCFTKWVNVELRRFLYLKVKTNQQQSERRHTNVVELHLVNQSHSPSQDVVVRNIWRSHEAIRVTGYRFIADDRQVENYLILRALVRRLCLDHEPSIIKLLYGLTRVVDLPIQNGLSLQEMT